MLSAIFNLLSLKEESETYEITILSVSASMCSPLVTLEPSGRFHEIQQGHHVMDCNLRAIMFKFIA
jgi:hypothetical protein